MTNPVTSKVLGAILTIRNGAIGLKRMCAFTLDYIEAKQSLTASVEKLQVAQCDIGGESACKAVAPVPPPNTQAIPILHVMLTTRLAGEGPS